MTSDKTTLASVLKEYLAPAGIGALLGAIATVVTVVPQAFDKTQQLLEQRRQLAQIEQDISAYSKVIRKMYPLLSKKQLARLFEGKGKTLINVDKGSRVDDDVISAELRQSPEGAYFVWCETSMNSNYSGASLGFWLTRAEAMAWANAYATTDDFRKVFGDEAIKYVDKKLQVGLCD